MRGRPKPMIRTVASIVAAHRSSAASPKQTIAETYARIRAHDDPAIFITLRDEADALAEARALKSRTCRCSACRSQSRTTSTSPACRPPRPARTFSYMPMADATAVARLRAAGAIVIGKTNLDQFATGWSASVALRHPSRTL